MGIFWTCSRITVLLLYSTKAHNSEFLTSFQEKSQKKKKRNMAAPSK